MVVDSLPRSVSVTFRDVGLCVYQHIQAVVNILWASVSSSGELTDLRLNPVTLLTYVSLQGV